MLKEEQVVSIKKLSNCYLKLISLVRYTFDNKNDNEFHKIFSNVKKIENFNEKLLYLFCVYVINSDEDVIKVLTDTGILSNKIIEGESEFYTALQNKETGNFVVKYEGADPTGNKVTKKRVIEIQ